MRNSIKDLVREIDYQVEYSYEQRVELFNKYNLSTSLKHINPILLLEDHLHNPSKEYGKYSIFTFRGVSHSGAVSTAFNKEFQENTNNFVKDTSNNLYTIIKIYHWNRDKGEFEESFMFRENKETGEIRFKFKKLLDYWPKKGVDFYEVAEKFCEDFGFNLKF